MVCLLLLGSASASAQAAAIRLTAATLSQQGAEPASVALPWDWDEGLNKNGAGTAVLEAVFNAENKVDEPYGLYFVRIGNRADIYLNNHLLAHYGRLSDFNGADYAKAPRFIPVPQNLLKSEGNVLRIVLSADPGRHAGLSEVLIGPASQVRNQQYASAYVWRILLGSVFLMALCVLVGLVAMLLWRTQRVRPGRGGGGRRDVFYLYAGLTTLSWAFYLADASVQFVPLSWPLWGALVLLARNGALYGMLLLARHAAKSSSQAALPGWLRLRVRWMLLASCLALSAAWLTTDWRILLAWYVVETVWLLAQSGWHLGQAYRHRGDARQHWIAWMLLASTLAAAHDWWVSWLGVGPSAAYGLRFAALFQAVTLSCLVVARFNAVSNQGRRLLERLSYRLRTRERKLLDSYEQLARAQREQARMKERARIMRDMHDGVGLHLTSAMRLLADERNSREQIQQSLRDALDQLKLSIDVMSLAPGDVTGLLSNIRFRLARRLESAGLALQWDVQELPPVDGLDTEQLGQLQYIVFEAISNVLQHAGAQSLHVGAYDLDRELLVVIADDGRGIAGGVARETEAGSMRTRAAEQGWKLTVGPQSLGHGTRVALRIPR